MSRRGPVAAAWRQYRADARGWGVPDFGQFRARLLPLRAKRRKEQWSEDDMMLVLGLEAEGAGYALRRLFGANPAAREVLPGEAKPELLTKDQLGAHMRALIRDCRRDGWTAADFGAFVGHLDRTPPGGAGPFAEMYRSAGESFRRHVREALVRAGE